MKNLKYYLANSLVLIVLLIIPLLQQNDLLQELSDSHKVYSSISLTAFLKSSFLFDIGFFIVATLVLHVVFVISVTWFSQQFARILTPVHRVQFLITVLLFTLSCAIMIMLNQRLYPNSVYATFSYSGFIDLVGERIFLATILTFILAVITSVVFSYYWKYSGKQVLTVKFFPRLNYQIITGLVVIILAVGSYHLVLGGPSVVAQAGASNKPNIIIIGLDSFRTDLIGQIDNQGKLYAPSITQFVDSSRHFTDTLTPLARTFPSWVSLLAGSYPITNGIRFNLTNPKNLMHPNELLPVRLHAQGYKTYFATDERRFSNINEEYGFDRAAGPEMGASDFVLGVIGDLPLNNLTMLLDISKTLFPQLYGNRAASTTYRPEMFNHLLDTTLEKMDTQPAFLAVHLCLAHWPFYWADTLEKIDNDKIPDNYYQAVQAVDYQFQSVINMLTAKGYLDNALVIVISDHGNTWDSESIVFKGVNDDNSYVVSANGHGTDVTAISQNQIVFAVKSYGNVRPIIAGKYEHQVSILDITPTILDFLSLDFDSSTYDGISLLEQLYTSLPLSDRIFFTESGISLPAILKHNPDQKDVLVQGVSNYRVSDDGLLVLDDNAYNSLLDFKQMTAIKGNKMLAIVPVTEEESRQIFLDYENRSFINVTKSNLNTIGRNYPEIKMLKHALCEHFSGDRGLVKSNLCQS